VNNLLGKCDGKKTCPPCPISRRKKSTFASLRKLLMYTNGHRNVWCFTRMAMTCGPSLQQVSQAFGTAEAVCSLWSSSRKVQEKSPAGRPTPPSLRRRCSSVSDPQTPDPTAGPTPLPCGVPWAEEGISAGQYWSHSDCMPRDFGQAILEGLG